MGDGDILQQNQQQQQQHYQQQQQQQQYHHQQQQQQAAFIQQQQQHHHHHHQQQQQQAAFIQQQQQHHHHHHQQQQQQQQQAFIQQQQQHHQQQQQQQQEEAFIQQQHQQQQQQAFIQQQEQQQAFIPREKKIKSPVQVKEEPVLSPPESSSIVTGDTKAPQFLKKGPWTAREDAILIDYVKKHGEGNWNAVQKNIGLQRCGKSCRLRWANHLRPNLKKGSFTQEEEILIIRLHAEIGNKWARMAAQLPGRTDNEIKNYWNTRVKRRQRVGLPIYPPEIQSQVEYKNKRRKELMHMHNQVRPKDFVSHNSPTTITVFNNVNAGNGETNYFLRNFDPNLPSQQIQSSTFPIKMKRPSTELYHSCFSDQKVTVPQLTPQAMGQWNNALFDNIFQKSQKPEEQSNEALLSEHLSTNGTAMLEPLPTSSPQPPSNTKHLTTDPLEKLSSSNIPVGRLATKQSVETMVNQNVTNWIDTMMPATDSSSGMLNDGNIWLDMQQLTSNFSVTHDWNFESSSWGNKPT